ncbi:MAG: hypothetical protein V1668_00215 [Patescibacteria group bacterium]
MFLTIIAVCILSWPTSWIADTNLTDWCAQENITPENIISAFAVLDSILATEQRKAPDYDSHASLRNLGTTVSEFNRIHDVRLPQTPITADPDCRIYFAYAPHSMQPDTCPTLNTSIYVTTRVTNMPMVIAQRCLATGQTTYQFLTETGMLEYSQAGQYMKLQTYNGVEKHRYIIWSVPPLSPYDTMTASPYPVIPSAYHQ